MIIAGSCIFGLSIAVLVEVDGGYDLHLRNEESTSDETGMCVIVVGSATEEIPIVVAWSSFEHADDTVDVTIRNETWAAYPPQVSIPDGSKQIVYIRKGGMS